MKIKPAPSFHSPDLVPIPHTTSYHSLRGAALATIGFAAVPAAIAAAPFQSPIWTSESHQADALYGAAVSPAGDVNGDGFADVLVGAPYFDGGQTNEGRAFVYLGSAGGPLATPHWIGENNIASTEFAGAIASAGDVNNDGYGDIIVGAFRYDGTNGPSQLSGRAYVYHGSSSGLGVAPAWFMTPQVAPWYFGYSVSGAGDVNGDGFDDVIVGAPNYQCCGLAGEGQAYVYHGSASGLSLVANWTYHGTLFHDTLGIAVSGAGDVNGDGFDDVIVGTWVSTNRALIFFGSSSGLAAAPSWTVAGGRGFGWSLGRAGDVNADGFDDVLVGEIEYGGPGGINEGRVHAFYGSASGPPAVANWIVASGQAGAFLGSPASTAGDFNGDGFSDVVVGATGYDAGEIDEGVARLYLGSACGLGANPALVYQVNQIGATFGVCALAGDTNGDGFADVLIGAPRYDNGQTDEGRAYVYPGHALPAGGSAPLHDDPVGAILVATGTAPWSQGFDLSCATTSSCASSCSIQKDLWYRLEATACLDVTISTSGGAFVPAIAVYDGADCQTAAPVTCGPSPQTFQTQVGHVYLIRLGSSTASAGTGTLNLLRSPTSGALSCPPLSGPVSTRIYALIGPANNTEWSWAVTSCSFCGVGDFHVPPIAAGTAHDVADAFKASIDAAGCAGIVTTVAHTTTGGMFPEPKGLLTLQVSGSAACGTPPFTLAVGPGGGPLNCYPTILGTCTINPSIQEIAMSGADCNANGRDDVLDIGLGLSADTDGNLVPDECGAFTGLVFCAGDGAAPHTPCPCGNNSAVSELAGCLNVSVRPSHPRRSHDDRS